MRRRAEAFEPRPASHFAGLPRGDERHRRGGVPPSPSLGRAPHPGETPPLQPPGSCAPPRRRTPRGVIPGMIVSLGWTPRGRPTPGRRPPAAVSPAQPGQATARLPLTPPWLCPPQGRFCWRMSGVGARPAGPEPRSATTIVTSDRARSRRGESGGLAAAGAVMVALPPPAPAGAQPPIATIPDHEGPRHGCGDTAGRVARSDGERAARGEVAASGGG